MENLRTADHDEIMLKARQLRAETLGGMFAALAAWFRGKPAAKTARA